MTRTPKDDLRTFIERLFSINAPMIDMFGKGLPGMAGSAASTQGSGSTSGDVSYSLKQNAVAFAKAYEDPNVGLEEVKDAAQSVEGAILTEATLSTITQNEADKLIDQLMELIEARVTTS